MWDAASKKEIIAGFVRSFDADSYMHFLRVLRQRRGPSAQALARIPIQKLMPPKGVRTLPSTLFKALVDRWIEASPTAMAEALHCAQLVCGPRIDGRLSLYAERSAYLLPTSSEPDDDDDLEATQVHTPGQNLGASPDEEATLALDPARVQAALSQKDEEAPSATHGSLFLEAEEEEGGWGPEETAVVDASIWSTVNLPTHGAEIAPPSFLEQDKGADDKTIGHLLKAETDTQDTQREALFLPDLGAPGEVTRQIKGLEDPGNAIPTVQDVQYLPHIKAASAGNVELSLSPAPEGLHALLFRGKNLSIKGQLSFEGLQEFRGFDGMTPAGGPFLLLNAHEARKYSRRRIRYHHPDGQVGTPMTPKMGSYSAESFAPPIPEGAAFIPAGTYRLPTTDGQVKGIYCAAGFFLGLNPVTNGEFERFLTATRYKPQDETYFLRQRDKGQIPAHLAHHPVVYISHRDARAYAQWAGGRLPTEVEFMRACTGLDGRSFPWGEDFDVQRINSREARLGWTAPVGQNPQGAGPFGHQDLLGNIWEWMSDIALETRHGGADPREGANGILHRVIKGGSWVNGQQFSRVGLRSQALETERTFYLGFRVAWDLPEREEKTAWG